MSATPQLHPAQNRGLRELYATTRQLAEHWGALTARFAGTPAADVLDDGVIRAREMLKALPALTEARGLYGGPAAHSVGRSLAGSRSLVGDRFLERNQALRTAVLDVQHVVTLVGYQAELAVHGGDTELAEALKGFEREMLAVERAARRAAIRLGREPDVAVERLDSSPAGKLAHGAVNVVGTVGEWTDRRRGGS